MSSRDASKCVDCGTALVLCGHSVNRLLEPERSYQTGVEAELRAQLAAAQAELAVLTHDNADLMAEAAALRSALDLAHQALLAYRFPAGATHEERDRDAKKAIQVATRALASAADGQQQAVDGEG